MIGFRESSRLAAAYGLAVTATMVITTYLFHSVAKERWGWGSAKANALTAVFLLIDLAFLGATAFKIPEGGWLPLVIGVVIFTVLSTWRTGRLLVAERIARNRVPLRSFVADVGASDVVRTPGSAIYLFSTPGVTPPSMIAALRHVDSIHSQVVVVTVVTAEVPRLLPVQRTTIHELGHGFAAVELRFGFMEDVDVPAALAQKAAHELGLDLGTVTYVLAHESLKVTERPGMARWREHLFAATNRNAVSAANYFELPPDQILDIGIAVEL